MKSEEEKQVFVAEQKTDDPKEKIEEKVTEEVREGDPLEENENEIGSDTERVENNSENELGNDTESTGTPMGSEVENLGEDLGEDSEEHKNELGNNEEILEEEEPIHTEETEGDPLEEEPPTAGQERASSKKEMTDEYKEMLIKWSVDGINFLDEMKTQICVALGGGYASDYAAKKQVKEMFLESTRELLKEKEIGPPSPMQAFLMALAAMTVPSVLLVGYRRYTKPDLSNQPIREKVAASAAPEDQIQYKDTIEYKEGRTRFKIHSSGAYQYDLDGEYVSADVSDAYPSAEVQKLLDEGKTSSEIKKIIYG